MPPIVRVDNLVKEYVIHGSFLKKKFVALQGISFELDAGKIYALVGQSGSGKSSLALILSGLESYNLGSVKVLDREVAMWIKSNKLAFYRSVQIAFQDPYATIDPFYTVYKFLREAIILHWPKFSKKKLEDLISASLKNVGLDLTLLNRLPYQISGGQRQRVVLSRCLLLKPKLLILDEVTSALDYQSQCEILELIKKFREEHNITILFITHDLNVAMQVSDYVIVLKDGQIEEISKTQDFRISPKSEYGKYLLSKLL